MLFCLGGASIFGWLLAFYQVPDMVTRFITAYTQDPIAIMVLIVVVNVLLGTFMDALPAILIFVPIIHPLAVAVGIHPVHLGVIVVMTQSFGLLTPPLGMVAMTACAVAGVPMVKIQLLLHLMMIPLLIVIVLCALAPWTVLAPCPGSWCRTGSEGRRGPARLRPCGGTRCPRARARPVDAPATGPRNARKGMPRPRR